MTARRYPLGPLLEADGSTRDELAARLGAARDTIDKAAQRGLSERQADAWACALDLHPMIVWPAWQVDLVDVDRRLSVEWQGAVGDLCDALAVGDELGARRAWEWLLSLDRLTDQLADMGAVA